MINTLSELRAHNVFSNDYNYSLYSLRKLEKIPI